MIPQPKRKKKSREPVMSDPVDYYAMDEELQRLRAAITLLANCCGAHIISQDSARRLMELLKSRWES
jgi:hypothetical protein